MRRNWILWFIVVIIVVFLSLVIGRYPISLVEVSRTLVGLVSGNWRGDEIGIVVLNLRLPRVLVALLVGASLSVSGVAYQSIFRNPLASPDILGVTAGAGFGGLLALLIGVPVWSVWFSAMGFGLIAMSMTAVIARSSRDYRIGFLLSGLIVTTVFSSMISLIKIMADPSDQLPAMVYWLMGSLSYSDWGMLRRIVWPLIGGMAFLWVSRWRLNLLMLNQSEIKGLGLDTIWYFYLVILVVTLMTAVVVSAVGIVGWVGLVIPHIVRLLVGEDNRQLVPLSMILGGAYLVILDTMARSISSQELPIGIFTAIGGAVIFLVVWKLVSLKRKYD